MNALPHIQEIFDSLRGGCHLSPEHEPAFSAVTADYEAYAEYFKPLGLNLVRHPREFFYFEPESVEKVPETLPRIAIFSFIMVDHADNTGKPIEDFLLNQHFLISRLPHLSLDRYAAMLRQVEVEDVGGLRLILKNMERLGWLKFHGEEEFSFLRPFHRVFDKCLELSAAKGNQAGPTQAPQVETQ